MNHSAQGMKHSKSLSHLTPIAPAPLIAPRPVQVLPKPVGIAPALSSSATTLGAKQFTTASASSSSTSVNTLDKSMPCIITSKQWVLPPRPKAGRKPVNEKKKQPQQQQQQQQQMPPQHQQIQQQQQSPSAQIHPQVQKRQNSVTSMTTTMNNLNIHKSVSENIAMNRSSPGSTTSTITGLSDGNDLKHQLESATQENQKLKSIISWLKIEIEQLQTVHTTGNNTSMSPYSTTPAATSSSSPTPITMNNTAVNSNNITTNTINITNTNSIASSPGSEVQNTAAEIHYQLHGTSMVSTPTTLSMLTSREVSPSTVDPKDIGMVKPRQKRQYKKKAKKADDTKSKQQAEQEQQEQQQQHRVQQVQQVQQVQPPIMPSSSIKLENTPSPIAIPPEINNPSGLPAVEMMMNNDDINFNSSHPIKRSRTVKLERTISLQTDLLSPPSYGMHAADFNEIPNHMLSRTTTNTTIDIDPMEFGWPGKDCGFCQDGGPCLCLEKDKRPATGTIMEESGIDEIDVNDLFKDGNDYDEFLML